MEGKLNTTLIVFGVIVIIGLAYFVYASGPEISTQGSAISDAQPDEISVNAIVLTKNKTLEDAQKANALILEELIRNLRYLGFDDEDMQYSNYYSGEYGDWENGRYVNKGYQVSQTVIVKMKVFSKVSGVINEVVDAGAGVQSIQFELSNEKKQDEQAKVAELASKDARKKAEAIASGQGKRLGRLVELRTDTFDYRPYPVYMAESVGSGSIAFNAEKAQNAVRDIKPEDIDISQTVYVKYKLSRF